MTQSPDAGISRQSIAGTDPVEACAFFERSYNGRDYQIDTGADFAYRCSGIGDGDLILRSTALDGRLQGSFVLTGVYVVTWLTAGTGALTVGADVIDSAIGQPVVIPQRRSCHFVADDARESSMLFSAAYLEAEAAALHGAPQGRLQFALQQPTPEAASALAGAAFSAARVLHNPHASGEAIAAAKRRAAHTLLQRFPHSITSDETDTAAVRGSRAAAAITFMHARAHDELTIEQVAAAAGLTPRGIQDSFRRLLGTTPLEYLRQVRLERARDDFLAAATRGGTVRDAAQRWRMMHLGRFSRYYADHFGEQPSDTIRQARAATPHSNAATELHLQAS